MSEFLEKAAAQINEKIAGFDGSAKFEVRGEGNIVMDNDGARLADDDADVTLTADAETFRAIFDGDMNPTSAFMTGKLVIDGDMGQAMKLAGFLS
jgi:putative sterol carrier protein